MDVSPEEMLGWSITEIQAAIQQLVPAGWRFGREWQTERYWCVWFERDEPGEPDPIIEWSDAHADERIALFNAFGHLWMKSQVKPPPDDTWHRRRLLTREYVQQKAMERTEIPDLDPDVINSVYERDENDNPDGKM